MAEISKESGAILAQRGNRLLLIEGWMILLLSVFLYTLIDAITRFAAELIGLSAALSVLLSLSAMLLPLLFLTLPLFIGLMGMAHAMVEGREVLLSELFSPFTSARQYGRTLALSFAILWRLGGLLALSVLTLEGLLWIGDGTLIFGLLGGFLILIEWAVGLLLSARAFPMMALSYLLPRASLREVRRMRARFPSPVYHGTAFCIRQLPSFLLGVLTVGILLLADWLPRTSISYVLYCKTVFESMIRLEENRNE